jgi:MYXO-CTERM domain-containing protein
MINGISNSDSTITGLHFGSFSLNDLEQIAFADDLANGEFGIAIADPNAVPEPATALVGLMVLGIATARRRRR